MDVESLIERAHENALADGLRRGRRVMAADQDQIVEALRASVMETERLRRENQLLLERSESRSRLSAWAAGIRVTCAAEELWELVAGPSDPTSRRSRMGSGGAV